MEDELVEAELGDRADELVELVERRDDRFGRRPQEDLADARRLPSDGAAGLVQEGELARDRLEHRLGRAAAASAWDRW